MGGGLPHNNKNDDDGVKSMLPQEEAQLWRVYSLLCDYGPKQKVLKVLRPKAARLVELRSKVGDEETAPEALARELQQLSLETEDLKSELRKIEAESAGKITATDFCECLKALGTKASRKEVEDMIWEIDENLDGSVDWEELKLCFERNLRDDTGLEASKIFHVVAFCFFDSNDNGKVSVDETMAMLYARYGRQHMELKLKELFGTDLTENGTEGGEIDFPTYLRAVEKTQLLTFLRSTAGKNQLAKAKSLSKLIGPHLLDNISSSDDKTPHRSSSGTTRKKHIA